MAERVNQYEKEKQEKLTFYDSVVHELNQTDFDFAVMGGYCQYHYGQNRKPSADFDIGVHPDQAGRVLQHFSNRGVEVNYKHPDWLNQLWSKPGSFGNSYSIDVIHRHSTGLTEVAPWWINNGNTGQIDGMKEEVRFLAPEALAITKVLLWSARAHDIPDAASVVRGCATNSNLPSFDWSLFIDQLGPDWRLGYLLAAATQDIYQGRAKGVISKATRRQLEHDFTDSPIPGPVRGHVFGWRLNSYSGNVDYWNNPPIEYQSADITTVKRGLDSWPNNPNGLIEAANHVASSANINWGKIEASCSPEKMLELLLSIEILYGERSQQIIPDDLKAKVANKFTRSA